MSSQRSTPNGNHQSLVWESTSRSGVAATVSIQEINRIIYSVQDEVKRATSLHGPLKSLHEAKAVIEEEFDEFWEEVKVNPKKLTTAAAEKRLEHMRVELVQIAAMCVRTILDMEL